MHSMIPTEVGRLEPDDILLNGTHPYLRVLTGKTALRRRIVPIVVGLEVMRESLPAAVAWIRSRKEPSATINKRLQRWTGDERYTLYWLRHTWNDWASAAQIDVLSQAFIGGWSWRSVRVASSGSRIMALKGLRVTSGCWRWLRRSGKCSSG